MFSVSAIQNQMKWNTKYISVIRCGIYGDILKISSKIWNGIVSVCHKFVILFSINYGYGYHHPSVIYAFALIIDLPWHSININSFCIDRLVANIFKKQIDIIFVREY